MQTVEKHIGLLIFRNLVCSFLNSVKTCMQLNIQQSLPQAEEEKLISVCIRCQHALMACCIPVTNVLQQVYPEKAETMKNKWVVKWSLSHS